MRPVALLASLALVRASFFYNLNTGESQSTLPACIGIKDRKNDDRPYWIVDGQPVWTPTEECAWHEAETKDVPPQAYYYNSVTHEVAWNRPDAMSWVNMSREEADKFYVNRITTETSRPGVLGYEDKARGATYFLDKNGKVTWDRPVEAQWIKHHGGDHEREYFVNPVLNLTVWELPANASIAWQEWHDYKHIVTVFPDEL
jgi:hypothetical protein